jgi:hypothetical protein
MRCCSATTWRRIAPPRDAVLDVAVVGEHLIDSERWTPERTQRLLDDIWTCGPASVEALAA